MNFWQEYRDSDEDRLGLFGELTRVGFGRSGDLSVGDIIARARDSANPPRVICPVCEGGKTREQSCVIFLRPDRSWYSFCHRGTCSEPEHQGPGDKNDSDRPTRRGTRRVLTGRKNRLVRTSAPKRRVVRNQRTKR